MKHSVRLFASSTAMPTYPEHRKAHTVDTSTRISALSLLIAIGLVCVPATINADINDGVVAVWTFDDGRFTDAVGRLSGELKGGARIVDGGKFGKALDVDGNDSYAAVKLNDAIEEILEKGFTVGYWLYIRKAGLASGVWKGDQVGWGPQYTFRIVTRSNASLSWGTTSGETENWFNTINAIELNRWFYVCLTADGVQAVGYVTPEGGKTTIPDSIEGNPKSARAPYNLFPDRPLEMGRGLGIGDHIERVEYLDGQIDEVIIWNRALTHEEVRALGEREERPTGFAVETKRKLVTTWGQIKSY